MTAPITSEMKVEEVLERYPHLLEAFLRHGFTPLKNPLMRRTMAPFINLRGAAKMKHWSPETLESFLVELNGLASSPPPTFSPPEVDSLLKFDLADLEGLKQQMIFVSPEVVTVDNRGLEPPEPMMRILSILPQLSANQRLEALNDRPPAMLFPRLAEMGYAYDLSPQPDGSVRVTIRREG